MTVPGASEVCELTEVKAQIRQQRVILEKMLQEIEARECAELAKEKEAFEKQHHVDKLFSRYPLRAKGGGQNSQEINIPNVATISFIEENTGVSQVKVSHVNPNMDIAQAVEQMCMKVAGKDVNKVNFAE